jgi:hypothetical protein
LASRRQIIANRCNAQKSTGPRTTAGKHRSRFNAVRHGLTAETVIDVCENADEYQILVKRMIRAYRPRSVVEHELVVRLASLLWRLRRATAIETGLFSIQAQILRDLKVRRGYHNWAGAPNAQLYEMLGVQHHSTDPRINKSKQNQAIPMDFLRNSSEAPDNVDVSAVSSDEIPKSKVDSPLLIHSEVLAQCFLRVARLDDHMLERISRYEVTLWRQAAHVAMTLQAMRNNPSSTSKY